MKPLLATSLLFLSFNSLALSEYEQFLQQNTLDMKAQQQEFKEYLDANDKAFIGFLKGQWQEVEVKKPREQDNKPKPIELPKAPEPKKPEPKPVAKPNEKPVDVIKPPTIVKPTVAIKPPVIVKPVIVAKPATEISQPSLPGPVSKYEPVKKPQNKPQVSFEYFGHQVRITKNSRLNKSITGRLNNDSIADFWQALATAPHKDTINELIKTSENLVLNDWGRALLFNQFVKANGVRDENSRQLVTWFLLTKAGYNARLAYNQNAYLLLPSQQAIYGVTYFTFKGTRYYALDLNGNALNVGKAYTYSGSHGDGLAKMNFKHANAMKESPLQRNKKLHFKYNGETFNLNINYDLGLIEYSNTVPQLDLSNYPSEGLSSHTAQQLLEQLQPIVQGQSEVEAVNRIMRFVQTAFAYQTDGEQFKTENYLFPVETLHYPYSDCEDRAALFAWIVQSLLKLDVVLLDYPGHVAAAVAFKNPVKGDSYVSNGKRYTVTDPTYINSTAGMSMPQFKKTPPKVVRF